MGYAKSSLYGWQGASRYQPTKGPSPAHLQRHSVVGHTRPTERRWLTRAVTIPLANEWGLVEMVTLTVGWVGQPLLARIRRRYRFDRTLLRDEAPP